MIFTKNIAWLDIPGSIFYSMVYLCDTYLTEMYFFF